MDLILDHVMPRLVDWYNSFVQGDEPRVSVTDFTTGYGHIDVVNDCVFGLGIYAMRQLAFTVDSGDEGGPAFVTALFSQWDDWNLVSIVHYFDGTTDLVFGTN